MATSITYTSARANLKKLCEQVISTREPVIIHRRNSEDVALVSAGELESLLETAHLLRSPTNAKRLLTALERAQSESLESTDIESLKADVGFDENR